MYKELNGQKEVAEAIQTLVNRAKEQGKALNFDISKDDFTIMENPCLNPYDVTVDPSDGTLTICGISIYLDSYNYDDYYWKGWQDDPDIIHFNNQGFEDVLYLLMIDNF